MAVLTVPYDPEHMAKAQEGGFSLMPAGDYVLCVQNFEHKEAKKQGGSPMIEAKCQIEWAFNNQNIGKTITRRFSMSPKSTPYNLIPFLRAAGIPFGEAGPGAVSFDDALLLGARTRVTCKHQEGESRTFEDWRNDSPVDGPAAATGHRPPAVQSTPQGWQPPMQQPGVQMPPAPHHQGSVGYPAPQQGYPQTPPSYPQQGYQPPGGFQPPMQQPQQPQYPQPPNGQQQPAWPTGWPQGGGR